MDEQAVRDHAQEHCEALLAGDIGRASQQMSAQLQAHLGQIVAMLPMPLSSATVESVERTGSGFRAVLRLVGESAESRIETRWKEREGRPVIVEASHLTDTEAATDTSRDTAEPSNGA